MLNNMLEKHKLGSRTVGTFSHLETINAAEALGYTGLDYIVFDMEHSPATAEGIEARLSAALSTGMTPIVRIGDHLRSQVQKALDIGAQGILAPMVKTVEDAERLVQCAKFPPEGSRGFCPTFDSGWGRAAHARGSIREYMDVCNENCMLILQCETTEALADIENIAAVPGVDAIFIGPFDLSIAMGIPGQFDDPKFIEALEQIKAACSANGKMCLIFAGNSKAANRYFDEGFDSVAIGIDTMVLIEAYRSMVGGIEKDEE